MIEFTTGDLFQSDVQAWVNPVNCVGVMGRGLALQFKKLFPGNFKSYAAACQRGELQPGRMWVYEIASKAELKFIINFPTKRHWREQSRIEDIETGLLALVHEIRAREIRSIALPALGSGLGGLDWNAVRARIEDAMRDLDGVRVLVYERNGMH